MICISNHMAVRLIWDISPELFYINFEMLNLHKKLVFFLDSNSNNSNFVKTRIIVRKYEFSKTRFINRLFNFFLKKVPLS